MCFGDTNAGLIELLRIIGVFVFIESYANSITCFESAMARQINVRRTLLEISSMGNRIGVYSELELIRGLNLHLINSWPPTPD